jgi:hypothetical protein
MTVRSVGKPWNIIVLGNRTPRPQHLQGAIIKYINIYSNTERSGGKGCRPLALLIGRLVHTFHSPLANTFWTSGKKQNSFMVIVGPKVDMVETRHCSIAERD